MNEIIFFMNEAKVYSSEMDAVTALWGNLELPLIVTIGRYRVGRVLQRLAQLWSGQARFVHIAASFDEAIVQVQTLHRQTPIDALVAAGASGQWIRERVDIPLAMVEVRGLDLLKALQQAKLKTTSDAPRVGLVTFEQPSPVVAEFASMFGLGLVQGAYQGGHDAHACVAQLKAAGVGAVVAPGLVADLAEQSGMASVLLYSEASVHQALSDALLLANHRRVERSRHQRLETVLYQLQDGVVAVDHQGRICALNPHMAQLLGQSVEDLHEQQLDVLAPALSMASTLAGVEVGEAVVQLGGKTVVVRRAPIVEHGKLAGALAVCRDPAVIQRADRSLRASQRQRGSAARWCIDDYLGSSEVVEQVRKLARQFAACDSTVLITGKSGTGKELIAQGIHRASSRAMQPFLAINCAALNESLLESELFGYEDGAFTGSKRGGKTGLIEAAHTGTLFLDEIGDMPIGLQSRLLRVLQEREVLRVGSTTAVPVDVRVIAATHVDLLAHVQQGTFRLDLYYRLAVLRLTAPTLQERGNTDITALAQAILARKCAMHKGLANSQHYKQLLGEVLRAAADYAWPGNVRELENWVERVLACSHYLYAADGTLSAAQFAQVFPEAAKRSLQPANSAISTQELKAVRQSAEQKYLQEVLVSVKGDQRRACEILGISRATLWRRMQRIEEI